MDYGKLLGRAFEITRKYRTLWLFGFLLALFGGSGGGNFNFPSSGGGGGGDGRGGDVFPTLPPEFWQNLTLIIVILICVVLILSGLAIVLRFISRAALIGLVQELETAGTTPAIRRGFSIGADRFWSQLGIAIVINLPLTIVSLVLILIAVTPLLISIMPMINAGRDSPGELWGVVGASILGSIVMICCAALCLTVVYLIVRPFYEFMLRVNVIAKRGVLDSIREGYRLVRANLSNVAVLYMLVIGIGIGFAILMIPIALLLIGIPVGVGFVVGALAQSITPGIIAGACLGIPLILLMIFISGLFQVFEATLWTEGYLAISAPKQIANASTMTG